MPITLHVEDLDQTLERAYVLAIDLRGSQARSLVDQLAPDLQQAGVPLGLFTAWGPDFWDDFTVIVRMVITDARGGRASGP